MCASVPAEAHLSVQRCRSPKVKGRTTYGADAAGAIISSFAQHIPISIEAPLWEGRRGGKVEGGLLGEVKVL